MPFWSSKIERESHEKALSRDGWARSYSMTLARGPWPQLGLPLLPARRHPSRGLWVCSLRHRPAWMTKPVFVSSITIHVQQAKAHAAAAAAGEAVRVVAVS